MKTNIYSLPEEVLIHVFQYLDVPDRLVAGLVCKKWLCATDCRRLMNEVTCDVPPDAPSRKALLFGMSRQFHHFRFSTGVVDDIVVRFLKEFREQLFSLTFLSCPLDAGIPPSSIPELKIPSCDHLQFLSIQDCDVLCLFTELPSLTYLRLYSLPCLTDRLVRDLNRTMPHLRTFKLMAEVTCDSRVYKRYYYKREETFATAPSDIIFSFPALKDFLRRRGATLRCLDVTKTDLPPRAVVELSRIRGLRLEKVLFNPDLSANRIVDFCHAQRHLNFLDLSKILSVSDESVRSICDLLKDLRDLTITFKHRVNESVRDIFQLQGLRRLNLNFCAKISRSSFREAVSATRITGLEHLNLGFTSIDNDTLCTLLRQNGNITHLDLTYTRVSDASLGVVCSSLTRLRCLIIAYCSRITDCGLTGEAECDAPMDEADASAAAEAMDVDVDGPSDNPRAVDVDPCASLSNLKELESLDIRENSQITMNGCVKAIRFRHLTKLRLDDRFKFDESFAAKMREQNPALRDWQGACRK
ncbi:f-box domain-containing protein [Caerostris extrusa]|uniref:F-box domain-containing protein n=1 Tax=Caerostris extrusa TaxID=172846 RepID=A0AAV4PRI6_CAEEX|nr:f-box domain-containing protein [Caerostris extrusa]